MDRKALLKFKVVGLGEVLWDMLPDGMRLGGAPANFAYHAGALGAHAYIVSGVGQDEPGAKILRELQGKGLDISCVAVVPDKPTGVVSVLLDGRGTPSYIIHKDTAWDAIPWDTKFESLTGKADAVCYGTLAQRSEYSHRTIHKFLQCTPPDCIRLFDANLRQSYYTSEIIIESLSVADVLKLNEEELAEFAQILGLHGDSIDLIQILLKEFNLKMVALTMGSKGSMLYMPNDSIFHAGYPINTIADTVGAGDSFSAALIMGLLQKEPLEKVLACANQLASYVCSQPGAMPPYPPDGFLK